MLMMCLCLLVAMTVLLQTWKTIESVARAGMFLVSADSNVVVGDAENFTHEIFIKRATSVTEELPNFRDFEICFLRSRILSLRNSSHNIPNPSSKLWSIQVCCKMEI